MSFLTPWIAVVAAALAVPLLLLLYFLKLRRRRLSMASTLLWRQSFEDLQANVPFQRLRMSALFLIQLALLLLLLLAAAEPVFKPAGPAASQLILVVDRSASMNATDAGRDESGVARTRLAAARTAAAEIVGRLRRGSRTSRVMIIAFGAQPSIVTGFESRRDVLLDAIASITPTDEEADLASALQLAGTFASRGEGDTGEAADVVLISDGGVAPPVDGPGYTLRAGRFRFVSLPVEADVAAATEAGAAAPNVGIVSLSARRDYDDPAQVLVFARLVNAGSEPVETIATLFVDDVAGPIDRVAIGGSAASRAEDPETGSASVRFSVELPGGAVLGLRHSTRDVLAADDTAAVVLPPPARPRIALVRESDDRDPYLLDLLEESGPLALREIGLAAYEIEAQDPAELARRYDLLVFDGVTPTLPPALPSLSFGAVPANATVVTPPGTGQGGRRILSWQRQHPLMRHVALDSIVYTGAAGMRLPAEATALATGPDGPVIALIPGRAAPQVVVAFALARSNWPTHVSVAVFLQNALDYLTASRSGQASIAVRPGEAVEVRRDPSVAEIVITGPEDGRLDVTDAPEGPVTLPIMRRVGLYDVSGVQPPSDTIAVSMLSDVESDTRPRRSLLVNATNVAAGVAAAAAPREVWSWFVAAALALLVVEWMVYCRMSRV